MSYKKHFYILLKKFYIKTLPAFFRPFWIGFFWLYKAYLNHCLKFPHVIFILTILVKVWLALSFCDENIEDLSPKNVEKGAIRTESVTSVRPRDKYDLVMGLALFTLVIFVFLVREEFLEREASKAIEALFKSLENCKRFDSRGTQTDGVLTSASSTQFSAPMKIDVSTQTNMGTETCVETSVVTSSLKQADSMPEAESSVSSLDKTRFPGLPRKCSEGFDALNNSSAWTYDDN